MTLNLDPATEARLERQLARGEYADTRQLIAHALDLIEAEQTQGDWLLRNREFVRTALEESFAAEARGESYSAEEAIAQLDEHRIRRRTQAA